MCITFIKDWNFFYLKYKKIFSKKTKKKISVIYYEYTNEGLKAFSFTGSNYKIKKSNSSISLEIISKIDRYKLKKKFFLCSPYFIDIKIY